MIECLPLSGIDLECVDGEWRTFYGCSLEGLFEFEDRRMELLQFSDSEKSVFELYKESNRFRFLVNRCLMLNGVKPAWVSIHQIEQLLFVRETQDGLRLGALVELNLPAKQVSQQPDTNPPTLEEAIALLSRHCASVTEAITLSKEEPAKKVLGILSHKAALDQPPEEKRRQDLKEFAQAERAKAIGDKG